MNPPVEEPIPSQPDSPQVAPLDIDFVRSCFPEIADPASRDASFFENAGGSFACRQTIDAMHTYYRTMKVQPYAPYGPSAAAGEAMDRTYARWAEALGVATDAVSIGPSTSQNTYVLAAAFRDVLGPDDEIVVTNQDHEANTGAIRRAAHAAGATVREWQARPNGLLHVEDLEPLLSERTVVMTMPHASNIVGHENDVVAACAAAHQVGAITIVDGVSFAPHGFADVGALGTDIYLFSLYKTYSVHQGLMVIDPAVANRLPNQGHFFNAEIANKRFTPAGPDHAQIASADAVLDYVRDSHLHHGGTAPSIAEQCRTEAQRWQAHEARQVSHVLDALAGLDVTVVGADPVPNGRHRCPTIAFNPRQDPGAGVARLVEAGVWCSSGDFYAPRILDAVGIDPDRGIIRVSWVHYTSDEDIDRLTGALNDVFGPS